MCGKCQSRLHICKEVWYWTMVIYWSRFQKEVVFYGEEERTRNFGTISRKRCYGNSQKADILFSVQQLHCPGGNLKSKGHGQLSIHFTADYPTFETVFRIIVSANQLSLYGAVANMCEEFENHQDRSGQPEILMGQSIVLSEIKADVPLDNDIPSHQNLLLQRYEERIKLLSQENKVSKFCMDA